MSSKFVIREGAGSAPASAELSLLLNTWLTNFGPSDIFRTCQNCKHMNQEGPTFCRMYNMTPPVAVVIAGCPSHVDVEEIPF